MELFWKILGLATVSAVIALTLRTADKPVGLVFSLFAGAALLTALIDPLRQAVDTMAGIARTAEDGQAHLALILKMLGVAFASELAAQACRDAGEEGIALRVEMSAKITLLALAAPVFKQMAQMIQELTA